MEAFSPLADASIASFGGSIAYRRIFPRAGARGYHEKSETESYFGDLVIFSSLLRIFPVHSLRLGKYLAARLLTPTDAL